MKTLELIGYAASVLVFITFYMKAMLPLRYIGLCSNVGFLIYGYLGAMYPVLVLHALLLPLNAVRVIELHRLIRQVRQAQRADISVERLLPHMQRRRFQAGDVLFQKGEPAQKMYYVLEGTVYVEDIHVKLGSGQIAGIMGVFAPEKTRPWTARCQTDGEVLELSQEKVMQYFCEDPAFGMSLARLITTHAITDLSPHVARLPQPA